MTSHSSPRAVEPHSLAVVFAASPSLSSTTTCAPCLAKARAIAAPIPLPPPVTKTTWRASDASLPLPSFACSRLQYSISNVSASLTGSKRPTDSAAIKVAAQASPMSAVTLASVVERPRLTSPNPGIAIKRGRGSRRFLLLPTREFWRLK